MVEVCALDGLAVGLDCKISPNRAPESCAVARDYGDSVLEDVDGKLKLVAGLACYGVVLGLEVVHKFDVLAVHIEVANLGAGCVHGESAVDFFGVFVEFLRIIEACGLELCGLQHLGDGLRLDVGLLRRLEEGRSRSQNACHHHYYNGGVNYSVDVVVGIHG